VVPVTYGLVCSPDRNIFGLLKKTNNFKKGRQSYVSKGHFNKKQQKKKKETGAKS